MNVGIPTSKGNYETKWMQVHGGPSQGRTHVYLPAYSLCQRNTYHVDLRDAIQALHLHIHTNRNGWACGQSMRRVFILFT